MSDLTGILFGADAEEIHGPWRSLFSSREYSFREGLTTEERIAQSYDRLRQVNSTVADPLALANDMPSLTALHGWAGMADGGMTTLASIHYNLFLGSLLDHGYDGDLTEFTSMRRVGTFLCTEVAHGNDAAALETTATFDRSTGGFILNTPHYAASKFMPNTSSAGGAKGALVAARLLIDGTDHGVYLFLTPLTDSDGHHLPGVEVHRLPETAGSQVDHCTTAFHNVPLPFEALLQAEHGRLSPDGAFTSTLGSSRKRFLRSIGRVTAGKLCMASGSLGLTRHALAVAMRYAHVRQTSGMTSAARVPLMAHRSHHAPLLSAVATTYAATLLLRSLIQRWTLATDVDGEGTERLIAMAKAWITWQGRTIMTVCRERCGAQGLLLANGIAGHLATNEGTITAEGDNLVIWVKSAGETLSGGFTPPALGDGDPALRSLNDPRHLQSLLADLERIRYDDARSRLRRGRHPSPLARWNATVSPAMDLVDAHMHRLAGETLLAGAGEAESSLGGQLLTDLHGLFAMEYIRAHGGELLAHGRLTAGQFLELRDVADQLVARLQPHALLLTDGFAVPDEVLMSHPIFHRSSGGHEE
ncbi:acyl-CoA dehydrogenase [Streptomyces sp. NPDC051132]|uniref:acyl-CoA dehydrogenase family protein n=1 Tax=unclassified Streptomyces TaxID=2593676 RepID=UPI00343DE7DB